MTCSRCIDTYTWRALYREGGVVEECYGDDQQEHRGFAEVDASQVGLLEWVHPIAGADLRMEIPEGAEAVLFRRNLIRVFFTDPNTQTRLPSIYGLGWKNGNHELYLFKLPDGSVFVSPNRNAV